MIWKQNLGITNVVQVKNYMYYKFTLILWNFMEICLGLCWLKLIVQKISYHDLLMVVPPSQRHKACKYLYSANMCNCCAHIMY